MPSELTSRPIRRIVVSDEDYRAGLVAQDLPEPAADMLRGMFAASRQCEFAQVDPTLAGLLGRQPVPLRDVMRTAIGTS